ncbi:hypothetical protein ACVWWN_000209 [Mycobacterium sp. URHB0021]
MHAPDRITVVRTALRLSLAAAFLSAVADRFGWWEPLGQGYWGSMSAFADYTHQLVPFASGWLLTVIVWTATATRSLPRRLAPDRLVAETRWRGELFGAHSIWNRDGCIPRCGITAELQRLLRGKRGRGLRGPWDIIAATHH